MAATALGAMSLVTLVLTSTLIDRTAAIKCYGCTVDTCHTFDGSAAFEINCEYSTMCQKKIYPYRLNSGEQIESIQRGCANQEDKGMVLRNHTWVNTRKIIELDEGCGRLKKDSDVVYCHCRGDRCNGAPAAKEASGYHTDAMAVIFVFNVMKYLRSIAD